MFEINKIKKENGFSLIEVLVVLSIIAIISVIAASSFVSFASSGKVRDAATELMQEMKLTKIMAMKTSTPYVIVFDTDENSYSIGANPTLTGIPGSYGTTGAPKTINLSKYGNNVVFGTGTDNAPSDQSGSCGTCVNYSANPVAFGVASPMTQFFNIDGTVTNPPGHALITHTTQMITYMVKLSFETGKLDLWKWDGSAGQLTPDDNSDCSAARRRSCGWTEIR